MQEKGKYLLPRLSVQRPVSVVMVLVALLVVGSIAYTRTPVNLFPEGLEGDRLGVWVNYPNASPLEVEQKIARPLEEAVATVSRVDKILANSSRGGCWVSIHFRPNTDMKLAYAELRDRMERVMPELPDEIERISVRRWDQNDIPIMWMVSILEGDFGDPYFLLDTYLRPALQRIEGVGNVEIWGGRDLQVIIELDQEKVRSHGVNVYELVGRLRDQNFALPGGYVREGGKKILVRSIGKLRSVEEIRALSIDPVRNLKLADIAIVELAEPPRDWINRVDRKNAMGIEIQRTSGGNIAQISTAVRQVLEELKKRAQFQGVDFEIFWDQGEHVAESVDNLKTSGLWGGIFAALVLYFFLRAVRMTAIITLAIPLSILVTITMLYFAGWSLNIGTMMGLMLSLGLVVDNAIVIVENIYRKRQEGSAPRRAAIEGSGEVGLAVTMATLTTVVVFLPLILMSDNKFFSFWMLRLGVPVIVGLVASLFIALVFIPLASLRLSAPSERSGRGAVERLREFYLHSLKWVLGHRLDALILVLLAMASIAIPQQAMQRTDQGQGHRRDIDLHFDMPSGQSLSQANEFMSSVEDTLLNHRAEYNIRAVRVWFSRSRGEAEIIFNEDDELGWYQVALENLLIKLGLRQRPHLQYKEVVDDVKERLPLPPGVSMRVNWEQLNQDAELSISLYGDDTQVLMRLSGEVERRLGNIPGLLSVRTDIDRGSSELQVRLDRDRVQRYGINPQMVSNNISYGLRGLNLSRFQSEDGKEVEVWLQFEEGDRQSIQKLRGLTFASAEGEEIPLEALADLYVTRTLGNIKREDRQTTLSVTARTDKDDAAELFEQVDWAMRDFEMPRGYHWDKGARYERLDEADKSQQFALLMSIIFVFLLMGVLFESFVLPLSVIVSIPFALLGVFWFLYLTGTSYDIMSMIGTVILVGVVVNNAIVLIDLTNRLRAAGMERYEALLEAGKHRFRPILMTSFTTICGLIPMAAGNSKMVGMPYAPLGRTMIGGLLASMVLTLVVVPLCYTFFDDLRELFQKMLAAAFKGSRREAQGAKSTGE